nr:zinc finger, CCHC-type [Tanacetum cinerariifolium]
MKSGVAKHLGGAGIQQQNRNMDFNESGEYKKTFISSSVGTSSMQVLHEFEFEVKSLGDHTFEVDPKENIDQGAGLQEVQTQDLMDYQLACDMEQHLASELFGYREDSNEAAFAVAVVEKIYAHGSLTFNNTVACEVISKWKAGLKDDMDARLNVYVLSNSCRKCSDDSDDYYWEYTLGLLDKAKGNVLGIEIVRDQIEGSLSGDCDVKKNGKWSCIYAIESQEYQMVCTRLDIAFTDVGSLKVNLQHMEALSITEAGYMTFTKA